MEVNWRKYVAHTLKMWGVLSDKHLLRTISNLRNEDCCGC